MSNRQGASGANKSRLHNVNSVYSGKNTAATKASGPGKHGLQPLGKATAVVRRMPPPATLPSLKAEHGQDPLISIVPQGGTGWTTKSSSTDTENNKQNGSTDISGGNAPDLRPTWAKNSSSTNSSTMPNQASTENSNSAVSSSSSTLMTNYSNNSSQQSQGTAAQIVAGQSVAPPNNRDFPSLAASVAAVTGSKSSSDTGSLKPQKTSAWGTNLADANVEIPHIPVVSTQQNQSGGYIGASTAPKPHVERIIPQRYISSQPPINQSKAAAKIGIREKLARFSMESKEPSVDAENKAVSEQDPAKQATESPTVTESPKEVAQRVAPQQQPPTTPTAPINQQFSQPPPQLRSQDVRQLQPSQFPVPEQHHPQQHQQQQPPTEWQQNQDRYVNGAPPPYGYDQQQKLLQSGRGEGGYPRGMMQQQQQHGGYPGGGIVGQQRFDERGNPYGERQIEELGWGDDLPIDNRRGMINQNQNRNNRYRIDSRSSTEADSNTWQGPPQHYGQQQQVGPPPPRQQPMPPQNAGWYDNSGYPLVPGGQDYNNPSAQYPPNNNYNNQRSRNSSVATPDYNNYDQQQQHQKGPHRRHPEFDYRQQGYQGYPSGGQNYHEPQQPQQHHGHDNSQQHRNMPPPNRQNQPPPQPHQNQQQQQQRYQQPEMPYRMLKRNDEKSAEYIAHHGGGPILQQQQQSSVEEETKPKSKESKSRSTKGENDPEAAKSASVPPAPKENVWEKRMEERKKEVVNPKPNSRFQQELDYNFPSIHDVPKDISEWNPPPPPPPASDSSSKNSRKGPRRNDTNGQYQHPREQRTPRNAEAAVAPLDPETLGSSHWVQEKTGPSWDNLSIPADHRPEEPLEEDDVYTGTKREFVNSKRSRGGQFKTGDFASRDIRQKRGDSAGGIVNGKKSSSSSLSSKPTFDSTTKRSSRAEDNFSNMGEFHAEDYKIPEESATTTTTTTSASTTTKKQHRPRDSNTFESNEGYDSSRRGSKRGVPRQPRGNNNWKGSERLPRNTEQRETGNEEHFERYDTSAVSASMRGNGRRLAPMGGNGRGRFLSKHTNKPTRHKPHFEGGLTTSTTSSTTSKSSNRASADRNVEGLKSPAASEGVDEWETASESSDVGGREEQQPQPQEPQQEQPQRERKNLTNGIRNSSKYQSNNTTASDTNSVSSSNSKEVSQSDEISSTKSPSSTTSTTRTNQKNVNPASHTYLGNGVSAKSSNAYNKNNSSSNGNHQPLQQNNKQRLHNADTSKAENIKDNARDNRKGFGFSQNGNSNNNTPTSTTTTSSIHMGLAGVDINDASVIVIDNQPDIISRDEFGFEEAGDFEEVLSKKQKKQRLLQVEEEKRKEQKEKEKAEKIQARKKQALQQKNNQRTDKSNAARKSQEKSVEKEAATAAPTVPTVIDSKKVKPLILPPKIASPIRKNVECDLGTSIWNNTLAAASAPTNAIVEKPHIPSPIARPTKSQTALVSTPSTVIPTTITTPASTAVASSLTIDVNAVKEGFETFTIATSTVTTATTSACYDFAYDSTLKTASPIGVKPSPKLTQEVIVKKPTDPGLVELNSDHVQLKEKLDKVKDFWPGQADFDSTLENGHIDKTSLSQAHGPNVAKVKPQPQHPHDSQQQQQSQQMITSSFISPEVKAKTIETTFNAFAIPPSQSPNLYQRGNAVFAMGPTSPFRQISSNQIYSMPTAYGNGGSNDFIQQPYGSHANSPPIQSYFGGQMHQQQQQPPSRPQSYDGMFNSNQLWNSNGIDILSTITPPLQQQQQQHQSNQGRYMQNNSRPPSHQSINAATMPPNGFPPTHLPPPQLPPMGYQQQQQQFQQPPPNHVQQHQQSNSYIPTHIPPPSLPPHTYIELMNGPPPPPPPIGASRNNNNNGNNTRTNPIIQPHQQNNNNNYRPPPPPQQMQILRPQQFNNNNNFNHNNGIPFPPPPPQQQQHFQPQQQYHHQQPQQYQGGMVAGGNMARNQPHQQQPQNRGQIQQWQKQDQQPFHQQNNPQQNMNGHPSNYGGYFNIKYSTTTNQPTA